MAKFRHQEQLRKRLGSTAVLLDIDGTLAPIVAESELAAVPDETLLLLNELQQRCRVLAFVTGRPCTKAAAMAPVLGSYYVGLHGAELLTPGSSSSQLLPELSSWLPELNRFIETAVRPRLNASGLQLEDKRAIYALHWRAASDPKHAEAAAEELAKLAIASGLNVHRGRSVLEIRPPVQFSKGSGVEKLLRLVHVEQAVYVGDDTTDIDALRTLKQLELTGALSYQLGVAVDSLQAPPKLLGMADLTVSGTDGVTELLRSLL